MNLSISLSDRYAVAVAPLSALLADRAPPRPTWTPQC